jgi:hypothetical protein
MSDKMEKITGKELEARWRRAERLSGLTREQAMEPNPILDDLVFEEAPGPTHRCVIDTPLPKITYRRCF